MQVFARRFRLLSSLDWPGSNETGSAAAPASVVARHEKLLANDFAIFSMEALFAVLVFLTASGCSIFDAEEFCSLRISLLSAKLENSPRSD